MLLIFLRSNFASCFRSLRAVHNASSLSVDDAVEVDEEFSFSNRRRLEFRRFLRVGSAKYASINKKHGHFN